MCRHVLAQHQAENGEAGSEETQPALDGGCACSKAKEGQRGHCGHDQASGERACHERLPARELEKPIGSPVPSPDSMRRDATSWCSSPHWQKS